MKRGMKKELVVNKKNTEFVNGLDKIYMVVQYAMYAVLEFPFTGEYEEPNKYEKIRGANRPIPLVYEWDDCDGTYARFFLRKITSCTSAAIVGWYMDREIAEEVARVKNGEALNRNINLGQD